MEKIIAILLFFIACNVNANHRDVYISIPTEKIKKNSEFYVDLMAHNLPAVYGAHLTLKYDPTQLTVLPATSSSEMPHLEHGNLFKQNELLVIDNRANTLSGVINYTVSQAIPARNLSNTNRVARVFFKNHGNTSKTYIKLEEAYFNEQSGSKIYYSATPPLELQFANSFHTQKQPKADFSLPRYLMLVGLVILFGIITLITRKTVFKQPSWLTRASLY
ncbi:cohesin domain-containing protein [Pseudoalteromonas umbrosa]|uniref:cohesin domain-containing protein n=1 Tax=Pseudoalteromonas umbrosa TaxID=3048489 RepID=UPI0024C32A34|nr:cohesin domain-containing protein [Pseudoalteromonas sp. B95]MDK1288187.1 cohesin domain-containing protein [Pseudoalteromonas sp. B95]